jgi:hypothetical protein
VFAANTIVFGIHTIIKITKSIMKVSDTKTAADLHRSLAFQICENL